jgi:hypothetical protein
MQTRGNLGNRVSRFVKLNCLTEVHSLILAASRPRPTTVLACDVRPIQRPGGLLSATVSPHELLALRHCRDDRADAVEFAVAEMR